MWREHRDDGYCDAKHCRKPVEETHNSKRRAYAVCGRHIEQAITDASKDNGGGNGV